MATSSGLPPSVLEHLVNETDSAVAKVITKTHLALAPSSLANLKAGVAQYFSGHINRYYPPLKGILLGYQNPKLTAKSGHLIYDQPFIHLDVQAEFFVFSPIRGGFLYGVVNRKSSDHLGCLVHDTFNVSLVGGKKTEQEGERVKIEVTALSYGRDSLPLIQARRVKKAEAEVGDYDSGIEVHSEEVKRGSEDEETKIVIDSKVEGGGDDSELREGKKHKKKKKDKDFVKDEVVSEPMPQINNLIINTEVNEDSKPKKKKKDKYNEPTIEKRKRDEEEVEIYHMMKKARIEETVDETGKSEIKKSKKKKNKDKIKEEPVSEREGELVKEEPLSEPEIKLESTPIKKKKKRDKNVTL